MATKKTRSGKKVKAYKMKWREVADRDVRLVWAVPGGGREITVSPTYFADCGCPVCGEDDVDSYGRSMDGEDMVYVRTEISK